MSKKLLLRYGSALVMVTLSIYVGLSVYDMFGSIVFYTSSHFTPHHVNTKTELETYKRLMNSWKFTGRPHALIYYAVPSNEDSIYRLKHYSLRRLENHFTDHYQYPIVIFHNADFPNWHMVDIKLRSSSPVFFQEVNFTSTGNSISSTSKSTDCSLSTEEQRMNTFHMKEVFEHPVFEVLDYYWRMDDESTLFGFTHFDLFNYMKEKKVLYGYALVSYEQADCVKGLRKVTEKFLKDNKVKVSDSFKNMNENGMFYNSFEIGSAKFWQQPMVKKYLKHVEESSQKGELTWSSALVHSYAANIFASTNEIYAFKDVYYKYRDRSTQSLSYFVWFYFFDVILRLTVVRIVAAVLLLVIVRYRRRSLMSLRQEEFQLINSKLV